MPTSQYSIKGKQLSSNTTVFVTHSFYHPLLSQLKAITTLIAALIDSGDWHWLRLWIRKKRPHMQVSLSTWAIRSISLVLWWWQMVCTLKQGHHEDWDSFYVRKWKNIFQHWRGKEQNPELLWENKCLDGGILFFIFDRLLTHKLWRILHNATHKNFKILLEFVSFLLMIRDSYALLQPIFDTVAC